MARACGRGKDERVVIAIPMQPPREVNPNARVHWRQRASAVRGFREAAAWAAIAAGVHGDDVAWPAVRLDARIEWCCGRKRMDDDNLIAALKPARDGIADVLFGGEDARVRVGTVEQVRGSGRVLVTLREA